MEVKEVVFVDLKAQVSYLKGLAEGLKIDEQSKEGKVIIKIIELLDNMVDELKELQDDHDELCEYTEAIDDDLTELEEDFFDQIGDDYTREEEDQDYGDGFTIECPNCREMVVVGEDLLDDDAPLEITCPGCGEIVLIDDDEEDWEEGEEDNLEEPVDPGDHQVDND